MPAIVPGTNYGLGGYTAPKKKVLPPGAPPTAAAPPPPTETPMPPSFRPLSSSELQGYITNDPIYRQQQADSSAYGIQNAATRQAGTRRALIQFGEIPNFRSSLGSLGVDPGTANQLFGDIDPATEQAAAGLTASGLSTTAGLEREHTSALDQLQNVLADRGMIRSGATGVGLGQEAQRYSGAQFTARTNLLNYLSGLQAAFAQSEQQRQGSLAQGASDAAARQISLFPNGIQTSAAPPEPTASEYADPVNGPSDLDRINANITALFGGLPRRF